VWRSGFLLKRAAALEAGLWRGRAEPVPDKELKGEPMKMSKLMRITERNAATVERMAAIWEAAVRHTHVFLEEKDVVGLRPLVEEGLREIVHLVGWADERNHLQGFIGVQADKIEMLFVDPAASGKGGGRQLVEHAIAALHARDVDVNEQNPQAVDFYEHMGFAVFGRSEQDGQGNPFPLLHMRLSDVAEEDAEA
jgi:putative acetyltransferase